MDDFTKAAAVILAETVVAARRDPFRKQAIPDFKKYLTDAGETVKGYAQRAGDYVRPHAEQLGHWAQDPGNAPWVGAAAGGALGGIGGLALGAGGKRKKSPWSTALTGALSGAALGGGLGAAYQAAGGVKGLLNYVDSPENKAVEPLRNAAHVNSPTPARIYDIVRGDPSAGKDTVEKALGAGIRRNLMNGDDPLHAAVDVGGASLGVAAGVLGDRRATLRNTTNQFTHGASELLNAEKSAPKPATSPPGTRPVVDPFEWQRAELARFRRTALTGDASPGLFRDIERARTGRPSTYYRLTDPKSRGPANELLGEAFRRGQAAFPSLPRTSFMRHAGRGIGGLLIAEGLQRASGILSGFREAPPVDLPGGPRE